MRDDRDKRFSSALRQLVQGEFGMQPLSVDELAKLSQHYSLLCAWNQRINLTRITEPEESARMHYAESLFGKAFVGDSKKVLDIGSGAGFPGVPLAVVCPALRVTALEVNQKKSLFLKETKDALHLSNFYVSTARVEDFPIEDHDLLASRALDRSGQLLPAVIDRMVSGQSAMLYTTAQVLEALIARLPHHYVVEAHPIPSSDTRLIAMIRR